MTHTPPIPAGNQSPYPLHEAPHVHRNGADASAAPPPGDPRIARTPDAAPKVPVLGLIAVGAGLGLAALAGGLFFALRSSTPAPKKRKRKAAKA